VSGKTDPPPSGPIGDTYAPVKPSFLSSLLLTYGTNIAVAVLSLVNVLIIARALGPGGRGEVALLTTIAYLTSQVGSFGVQLGIANEAVLVPAARPRLATNALACALVLGIAAAAVVALLIALFPGIGGSSAPGLRWLVLAAIPVLIAGEYLELFVQASYRFGLANVAWLLQPFLNVLVNGTLAAVGVLSVRWAVASWVAGQCLTAALLIWSVARRFEGFGPPDLRLAWQTFAFGAKTLPGRISVLGAYRLDQWLLGTLVGTRELGLYSVAVAWSEALFFLPTTVVAVQRPDLVRGSPEEAGRRAAKVFRTATVATIVGAVGLIVAAPWLCAGLFGESFGGSTGMLRVLALGGVGIVALKQLGNALTAQRKPLHETAALAFTLVLTVALDLALIPGHGGMGASLASTLSYTAGGALTAAIFVATLRVPAAELVPRVDDLRSFRRALRRLTRTRRTP
jgi:O-antigen/teichoic acid export membrane protein